jgi:type I restriction enzyme S subunit
MRAIEKAGDRSEWANEPLIDLGRMPGGSIALDTWGRGDELTTSVTRFRTGDVLFGAVRPYFHKVGIAPLDGVTNTSVSL